MSRSLNILADKLQLPTLLLDNMSDVTEQFVELSDALLDVANFGFTLDYQRILEVNFVL